MTHFLNQAPIDDVCFHSYNNNGGDNWNAPGFLAQMGLQARGMLAAMAAAAEKNVFGAPLIMAPVVRRVRSTQRGWACRQDRPFLVVVLVCGCAGGLARLGLVEFGRQSLVGARYEILNQTTFAPNPDFYILLAWKKVMGTKVLDVSLGSAAPRRSTCTLTAAALITPQGSAWC